MRNDAGQSYTIMRVLPGTFTVHGDADDFVTFHTDWEGAKTAFLAAVAKNKRVAAKNYEAWVAAASASLTVSTTAVKKWCQIPANQFVAEKYIETYALGFICLAYANGLSIQFGDHFVFLSGEEELPAILDQFEAFRFLPKVTPKEASPGAEKMTIQEIEELLQKYGLGGPVGEPAQEETTPL
jgi:hypothetical protein